MNYIAACISMICLSLAFTIFVGYVITRKIPNLTKEEKKDIKSFKDFIKHKKMIIWSITRLFLAILLLGTFFIIELSISTMLSAKSHGIHNTNTTFKEVRYNIKHTPKESKLPKDLTDSLIIYYRFDCPDCHATYDALYKTLKHEPNVYFVSTRSKQGKELLASYPIKTVPSGVYIKQAPNDKDKSKIYLQLPLSRRNENNKVEVYKENLDTLLLFKGQSD